MGIWATIKRGLGLGPPRTLETRRLQKRNRSGSFLSVDSGATFVSSVTEGGTLHQSISGSGAVIPTPSGAPEEIEVEDEVLQTETKDKPKRRFFPRLSRKKRPDKVAGPSLPSTSELMRGAAPSPSTVDDATRERVREAMGLPPRTVSSAASVASVPISIPTSVPASPRAASIVVPTSYSRPGSLSAVTRSSPKAPTPPLARQTPRLAVVDIPKSAPPSIVTSKPRSVSSRRISVREITEGGGTGDVDAQSVAAMSYVQRPPKSARIFEIAEIIPSERPLSSVTEESVVGSEKANDAVLDSPVKPTNMFPAIEQWAEKHRTRLDAIDEKLQILKAEVLQQKTGRRYFSV